MAQKDRRDWLKINDDVIMSSTILHDLDERDERVSGLKSFRFALLAGDLYAKTHETLRNECDIILLPKVHQ